MLPLHSNRGKQKPDAVVVVFKTPLLLWCVWVKGQTCGRTQIIRPWDCCCYNSSLQRTHTHAGPIDRTPEAESPMEQTDAVMSFFFGGTGTDVFRWDAACSYEDCLFMQRRSISKHSTRDCHESAADRGRHVSTSVQHGSQNICRTRKWHGRSLRPSG